MTELVFVLVRPAVPENVGAAARALKTMGFDALRLVASDVHRQKPARILAHGAGEILSRAASFEDLPSALGDCDLAVATSAKERAGKRYLYTPEQVNTLLANNGRLQRVAVVFGCEESGLSNEELACCDIVTAIPLAQPYPSLNLAQAVMLYAYELSSVEETGDAAEQADGQQWNMLKQRSEALLQDLGYRPEDKLWGWLRERLPLLTASDVGFVHLLLTRLQEKFKSGNE